ncbi:hypothetical protein L873DRAFT_1802319 [Choiromyces venosus 120613-1]|uniref:Uncharacterized protein n=1 Tax=Choiromyces venosus 120613-1 TaxID=1336337 RepID=A0A3N4JZ88_9PEZI|nr:hypothetical protein L873DRAFT_1802319 [Choiromyces venosus 120613-1]
MVQSPEAASFLTASTARKRRLEDLPETPNDLKLLWESTTTSSGTTTQPHQPSSSRITTTTHGAKRPLFLTSKFIATTSQHNTTPTTTTTPPRLKPTLPKLSHPTSSATSTTQAPKLKRFRASSPPPTEMDYDDYMHTSQDNPVEVPLSLVVAAAAGGGVEGRVGGRGVTPRCHVCSRVQSFATSFATVTNCARCSGYTCYVCTRQCDSCDGTVCSGCAEEEGIYCFCEGCLEGVRGKGGHGRTGTQ